MSSPTSSGILENLPLLWTGYIRSPKQDKEKMLRHVDKICLFFFFKQTKILQACVRKNHKEIVTSATTTRLDRYTPIKVTTKYVLCRKTRKSVARFGARTKWQATLCCVNKMQVVQVQVTSPAVSDIICTYAAWERSYHGCAGAGVRGLILRNVNYADIEGFSKTNSFFR